MNGVIKNGLIATAIAALIMCGVAIWAYQSIPVDAQVPLHWGLDLQPDRWGGRVEVATGLFVLAGVALVCGLGLALAPKIDPRKAGLQQASGAYLVVWIGLLALLVGMSVLMGAKFVGMAQSGDTAFSVVSYRWVSAGVAILMIVMGNVLPKTRPSFSFGIRTPWTLASATAWEKTHRLGGKLLVLAGVFGVVAAISFQGVWIVLAGTIAVLSAALVSVVYSYFAWRSAGDKDEGPEYLI